MYIAPVGIVNAGDPDGAYAEAIDIAGAHQSSYGREAAGVLRRGRRRGAAPERDVDDVVDTAFAWPTTARGPRSRRSPRRARSSPAGVTADSRRSATRSRRSTPSGRTTAQPASDARIPIACKAIEELPLALGLLVADRR